MNKQPERTMLTRTTFIETFIALSSEKAFDKITVRELADRAGYNRSTFYQYFNDTYHLLSCIEDDMIQYIMDTVVDRIDKAKPETVFIEIFVSVYENKRGSLKLLLSRNNNSNFVNKLKKHMIPAFAEQLQISLSDVSNLYLLDFYLSGIIAVITRWVSSREAIPPEEFAYLMSRIVEGIGKSGLLPICTSKAE